MASTTFAPTRTSPLDGMVAPAMGTVALSERRFVGKVNLRGDADDSDFTAVIRDVLGTDLPATPNTVSATSELTVFWLGPDEWLIHTNEDRQGALVDRLRTVLGDIHSAVTDVTDYYVLIEMQGAACRDVLARGCPVDFHPRVFGPGRCAQTHFSHANVLIHQVNDTDFHVQVRWSYARYLWTYLAEAIENMAGL